jgi:hypothetical protein
MASEFKQTGRYSLSDRLAIVLACLTGIMAIILFLIEKTPLTVIVLLLLMVGLSIYPILHFAKNSLIRGFLILGVVIATALFGWGVWPVVEASPQKPPPPVQQTNQGSNSNNTNINGNGNTVKNTTVIKRDDPRAKAQLDRIENLLRSQQDQLTPKKLLARYPLGYVIFDMDYVQQVFPYRNEALKDWTIDWNTVKLIDHGPEVDLTLPNMRSKNGSEFSDNTVGVPKEVGSLDRYLLPVLYVRSGGDIFAIRGEILAIGKDSIVFLLGFSKRNH